MYYHLSIIRLPTPGSFLRHLCNYVHFFHSIASQEIRTEASIPKSCVVPFQRNLPFFSLHFLVSFRSFREIEIIKTKCPLHTAVERAKEITRKIRWKRENNTISQATHQQNGVYSANLLEMISNSELYGRTINRCSA